MTSSRRRLRDDHGDPPHRPVAAVALAACILGSCADGGDSADPAPPGVSDPAVVGTTSPRASVNIGPVAPTFTTTTLVAAVFEFVNYRVFRASDGFTGQLRLFPDGRATYQEGGRTVEFEVSRPSVVRDLRAMLDRVDLGALQPSYGAAGPEDLQYIVLFRGRAVRFAAGTAPEALAPAVAVLDRELARGQAGAR